MLVSKRNKYILGNSFFVNARNCLKILDNIKVIGYQFETLVFDELVVGIINLSIFITCNSVGPPYTFHFRVKFYAMEPHKLHEELTRYPVFFF